MSAHGEAFGHGTACETAGSAAPVELNAWFPLEKV